MKKENDSTPAPIRDTSSFPHRLPYASGPEEIDGEDYHNSPLYKGFISSSLLKEYKISPLWFKHVWDHPEEKKIGVAAADIGKAYHDMMASFANNGDMSAFNEKYVIFKAPINPRTNSPFGHETIKYAEAKQQALDENPGKALIMESDRDMIKAMAKMLLSGSKHNSADIRLFLKNGVAEESFFLEHGGAYWKYRTDLRTKKKIVDWKTISADDLHEDTIRRQISKMGYHISAAFYQYMEWLFHGEWRKFYWVFQQKSPPYDFVIVDSSPWTYEIEPLAGKMSVTQANVGARIMSALLEAHIKCMESQEWPGASTFIQPGFLGRRHMLNENLHYEKDLIFHYDRQELI